MTQTLETESNLNVPNESDLNATCPEPHDERGAREGHSSLLKRRRWPIVGAGAMIFIGMGVMFWFEPVAAHSSRWYTPGDVWEIFRGAHYVGWGYLGGIYSSGTGIVTFPGMSVLLAPVAMVSSHFHLTESYAPIFLIHPTAALILQPCELLLTSTVLFASDALAERLDVTDGRRVALCAAVTLLALPLAVIWGHAEDAVAMTFAIYALIALLDRKWSKCGWLLGFGIVMQPLVLLLLPLFLGASPAGHRVKTAARGLALSAILIGMAFAEDPSDTLRAVVQQPAFPSPNHPTPWLALAPTIPTTSTRASDAVVPRHVNGHLALHAVVNQRYHPLVVSGGPGRTLYLLLAVMIGIFIWRRPQSPVRLMWFAAAVLAARCALEPVMCPYYLAPPLILALVVVSRTQPKRLTFLVVLAVAVSAFAYLHLTPWVWWLPVVAGVSIVLWSGYPVRRANDVGDASEGQLAGVPAPAV